ncbi:Oidioi.mRNA.OKI2018_I69.chr1.g3865.t1.cds [Oikopleura dioica]|uniref:HECT-type E3 ubiquitin transferase n=1 Tax=Oikopleura dioica TaxID=34765 RepID=A0ABN7SZS1_OIKDI|nr:Oidioi.mRNA.OKI2018_I69.chr1.g3865.t1.cds [Oikopleura dioica]
MESISSNARPQNSREDATKRLFKSIYEQFLKDGLAPDAACAKAIQELKNRTKDVNRNPSKAGPSGGEHVPMESDSAGTVSGENRVQKEWPKIELPLPIFYASELINRLPEAKYYKTHVTYSFLQEPKSSSEVDWDGLRRFYDAVEEQGGAAERAVVRAIREFRWKMFAKDNRSLENYESVVMTFVNPHIASPAYLENALPELCETLTDNIPVALESEENCEESKLVKAFAKLNSQDLLQIVQNLQQAITIRCVEIDTDRDVHKDAKIISYVRTMRYLFLAALVDPEPMLDWKANLQSNLDIVNSSSSQEQTENNEMDVDAPAAEAAENRNNGGLNEQTEDERVIDELLRSNLLNQVASGGTMTDPLCKKLGVNWISVNRPKIPYSEFVNEVINNALRVERDFINLRYPDGLFDEAEEDDTRFSFFHHPFMLNTERKTSFLFYDSREKQVMIRRNVEFLGAMRELPFLIINVSRNNIIQDTLLQLEMVIQDDPAALQKQFVVQFDGEQGIDEGGVSKEFFTLLLGEILKPDYGMFQYNEDTGYHQFNPVQFQDTEKEYLLLGMLLGLAIYNSINLDINLSTCIFKKLLGGKGEFQDLEFAHPDVYRNLTQLLEADKDTVESMCLTFSVTLKDMFGEPVEFDLCKNGRERDVDGLNKFEFVELYADFLLNKSIDKSFNAFRKGFFLVTQRSPLRALFRPEELEAIVIGQRDYDWDELKRTCTYDGGFSAAHESIKAFWSVFDEMDEGERRKLLEFYTGSDKVPVGGLARLKTKIQRSGPDSDRLPTAHTCFNILLLPAYSDREKLKTKLFKAMENAKGFGMI